MIKNKELIDRFFRYVKIDTQSRDDAETQPSTQKQHDLARLLAEELKEMGAQVRYDTEHCYVYARIAGAQPPLGFVAHMDTSPACSGRDVHPRLIENYQGEDTLLKTEEFPELLNHFGEDLIATDGTTLLGADDKAGVAEIMNLADFYLKNPEIPHREICIAFTPDEEVGRGTENFDLDAFGAKEAYTIDGGKLGVLEYECFNGAGARVDFFGKSVHTGSAKNTMINACALAVEFQALLPAAEIPEHTEGYEGFYHLWSMEGEVEHAVLKYIIRDHDRQKFEDRKETVRKAAAFMNDRYGAEVVKVQLKDQYYNMAEPMKDHMELIDRAKEELIRLGVTPVVVPIRGGTDGAALSFRGVPCPNLCTGGYNYHGRYEFASVQEMEKTAQLLIALVK